MYAMCFTIEEQAELQRLAHELVDDSVSFYQKVSRELAKFDSARWRCVKTFEDIAIYREYKPKRLCRQNKRVVKSKKSHKKTHRTSVSTPVLEKSSSACELNKTYSSSGSVNESFNAYVSNPALPATIAIGNVNKSFEEMMFENSCPESFSKCPIFCNSQRYVSHECLANVQEDSDSSVKLQYALQDGIRTFGTQWARRKEYVVLEHSKKVALENGDRVGVCVYHSVDHPKVPEIASREIKRVRISYTITFRERSDGSVDFVARLIPDASSMMQKNEVQILASLAKCTEKMYSQKSMKEKECVSENVQEEVLKKLMMVKESRRRLVKRLLPNQCAGCYNMPWFMSNGKHSCMVCSARVCSKRCMANNVCSMKDDRASTSCEASIVCVSCLQAAQQIAFTG